VLVVDIYLRIMNSIDQEVVSLEVTRTKEQFYHNSLIKDKMREQSLPSIIDSWYKLIAHYSVTNLKIARHVFEVLNCYIGWIDINLIVNERSLQLFSSVVLIPQLREIVIDCFSQVIAKGMPDKEKLGLISTLNLTTFIQTIQISNDEQDIDFQESVACLINLCGTSITEASSALYLAGDQEGGKLGEMLLQHFLILAFKFMNHPDDGVSEETLPFLQKYITLVKKNKNADDQREQISMLLNIIKNKISLDDQFDFDKMNEYESQTLDFRKTLFNLFKSIVSIHPQLAAEMVQSHLNVIQNMDPFAIEGTLQLFYLLGEGLSLDVQASTQQFFVNGIESLCKTNIPFHEHRCVVAAFYDNLLRYARYFVGNPHSIEVLLHILINPKNLRHPVPSIRSKCSEGLMKFLKSLGNEIIPFSIILIDGVKDFVLEGQRQGFDYDINNLMEVVGLVAGRLPAGSQEQANVMELFLTYPISQLDQLVKEGLYKLDTQADAKYSKYVGDLVTYIGTFSKGFPNQKENMNTTKYFGHTLMLLMEVTKNQPYFGISSKAIFFLHRMIDVMGLGILSTFVQVIDVLMNGSDLISINEVILLVNQVISTFKENSMEIINQLFIPFVNFIFQILAQNQNVSPNSEEEREVVTLRRNYYIFIHTIATSKCEDIFVSPLNAEHFQNILNSVREGCLFYQDPTVQLKTFSIFRRLCATPVALNGVFSSFLLENIIPLIFEVSLNKTFNLNDANTVHVLSEMSNIVVEANKKFGAPFVLYLKDKVFVSLSCPADFVATFINHINNANNLKNFLRLYFQELKTKNGIT
jgi:exportin-T